MLYLLNQELHMCLMTLQLTELLDYLIPQHFFSLFKERPV